MSNEKIKNIIHFSFFILSSILDASDIFIVKVNKVFDNNASYCIKFWCLNSNLCPCSIDNFKNIFPFLDKQNSFNYSQDNILCYGEKFEYIFKNEKIVSIKKNNQKVDMSFLLTQDKLDIKFHKTLNLSNNTEKTTQINTAIPIKNEWQIIGFNSVNEKLYCIQKNCFFCGFD